MSPDPSAQGNAGNVSKMRHRTCEFRNAGTKLENSHLKIPTRINFKQGFILALYAICLFLLSLIIKHWETKDFVKCCENRINESIVPKVFTAQCHRAKPDDKWWQQDHKSEVWWASKHILFTAMNTQTCLAFQLHWLLRWLRMGMFLYGRGVNSKKSMFTAS